MRSPLGRSSEKKVKRASSSERAKLLPTKALRPGGVRWGGVGWGDPKWALGGGASRAGDANEKSRSRWAVARGADSKRLPVG